MISIAYIIAAFFGFVAIVLFFVVMMLLSKFPWALKCMGASSLIFMCDADGTIVPTPAEKVVGVFKTKKDGSFSYERTDVLSCGKIPTIIAYKPIMRAVRPDISGIFRKLKKAGVGGKRSYLEILNATEMSAEQFRKEYEVIGQAPAVEDVEAEYVDEEADDES